MKKFVFIIILMFIINISILSNQAFAEENNQSDKTVPNANVKENYIPNNDQNNLEKEDLITNLDIDKSLNKDVEHIKSEEAKNPTDNRTNKKVLVTKHGKITSNNTEKYKSLKKENNKNDKAYIVPNNIELTTVKNIVKEENDKANQNKQPVVKNEVVNKVSDTSHYDTVIDTDDRKKVENINKAPYNSIVYVRSYLDEYSSVAGTGFIIDDYAVLTAAHVIENHEFDIKRITINAGYQNKRATLGTAKVIKKYVLPEWIKYGSKYYDIGLVIMDRPLGKEIGKLKITDKTTLNQWVTTSGYPGRTETNVNKIETENQYYNSGRIVRITDDLLYYDFDTEKGQSGSPVYNYKNEVVAIHTMSFDDKSTYKYNSGLRLAADKIKIINQWKDELKFKEYHKLIYLRNENAKIWSDLNLVRFTVNNTKENGRYFRTENLYTDSLGGKYALIMDNNSDFLGFISSDDYIEITPTIRYKDVQLNRRDIKISRNISKDNNSNFLLPFNGYYKVKEIYNLPNREIMYKLYDQNNNLLGYVNNYNVHEIEFKPYNKTIEIVTTDFTLMQDIYTKKYVNPNSMYHNKYTAKTMYTDNDNNIFLKIYDKNKFIGIINKDATKIIEIKPTNNNVGSNSNNNILKNPTPKPSRHHNKIIIPYKYLKQRLNNKAKVI